MLSMQEIQKSLNDCLFASFGKCSKDAFTNLLCNKHASQFFGVVRVQTEYNTNTKKISRPVVYYTGNKPIPFPFKYTIENDTIDSSPCFDLGAFERFYQQNYKEYGLAPEDYCAFLQGMELILTGDSSANRLVLPISVQLIERLKEPKIAEALSQRVLNTFITYTNGARTNYLPMSLVPPFYKLLLSPMYFSGAFIHDNDTTTYFNLLPNLVLSLDKHQLEQINSSSISYYTTDNQAYLYASPVVVLGLQPKETIDKNISSVADCYLTKRPENLSYPHCSA